MKYLLLSLALFPHTSMAETLCDPKQLMHFLDEAKDTDSVDEVVTTGNSGGGQNVEDRILHYWESKTDLYLSVPNPKYRIDPEHTLDNIIPFRVIRSQRSSGKTVHFFFHDESDKKYFLNQIRIIRIFFSCPLGP